MKVSNGNFGLRPPPAVRANAAGPGCSRLLGCSLPHLWELSHQQQAEK